MEDNTQCLQRAVAKILSVLDLPPLETFTRQTIVQVVSPEAVAERLQANPEPRASRTAAMAMTREHSLEPESNKETSLPEAILKTKGNQIKPNE